MTAAPPKTLVLYAAKQNKSGDVVGLVVLAPSPDAKAVIGGWTSKTAEPLRASPVFASPEGVLDYCKKHGYLWNYAASIRLCELINNYNTDLLARGQKTIH